MQYLVIPVSHGSKLHYLYFLTRKLLLNVFIFVNFKQIQISVEVTSRESIFSRSKKDIAIISSKMPASAQQHTCNFLCSLLSHVETSALWTTDAQLQIPQFSVLERMMKHEVNSDIKKHGWHLCFITVLQNLRRPVTKNWKSI